MRTFFSKIEDAYILQPFYIQKKAQYVAQLLIFIYVYALVNFALEYFFLNDILISTIQFSVMTLFIGFSLLLIYCKRLLAASILVTTLGFLFSVSLFFEPVSLRFYNQSIMVLLLTTAGYIKAYQYHSTYAAFILILFFRMQYAFTLSSPYTTTLSDELMTLLGATVLMFCLNFFKNRINNELNLSALIKEQMETDTLTKLSNRRRFESIYYALIHKRKATFMMLDLDHFKTINDAFGHSKGDAVLVEIGKILHHTLRKGDHAFRWGGEEFALLLLDTNEEKAIHIAERIRHTVEETDFDVGKKITISIGLSQLNGLTQRKDMHQAFIRADQALYQAKLSGRNQVKTSKPI